MGSGWQFTSGISYYTCRLSTALAADHDVSVILLRRLIPRWLYPGRARVGRTMNTLDYPPDMPVYNGIDWFWVPSMIGAVRFLRARRPDVVVLQWWTGAVLHSYLLLALLARACGAKLVVEFHEIQDTGEARMRGVARYTRALSSWLLARSDAFVVHSSHDQDAVAAAYPACRTIAHVLPHGPFDHLQDAPDSAAIDETVDGAAVDDGAALDGGAVDGAAVDTVTTVLFFGTIRPYKGLEHLVEAFSSLAPEQAAKLRLLIVGETWEGWDHPLHLVEASPYRDLITVVNRYVPDSEVSSFFDRSDAVVLPYLRSSASGPLHIAMSYGRPIVLSDVGGLRDGAAGYDGITWVPPGDVHALAEALVAMPALRGLRYADPRSWDEAVQVYGGIFTDLLAVGTADTHRLD